MTSSVHIGTTLRYQIVCALVLRYYVLRKSFWRSSYCNLSLPLPIFQNDLAEVDLVTRHSLLQEYERRFEIWADNLDFIESYNSDDKTHWVS